MNTTLSTSWERFCQLFYYHAGLDIALDVSRTSLSQEFLDRIKSAWDKAVLDMKALESGAIANPDENRMVGHYWLRAPQLAPNKDIRAEIELTLERIKKFEARIHEEKRFTDVLSIGIGGSALGPMFVHDALGTAQDKMRIHFFDNTDPDGMDRTLRALGGNLKNTLIVVISKSGGTPETFNGMIEAQNACKKAGLDFAKQAVAVTGADSKLDKLAASEGWLDRFPMWDWVGGRTSELSAVGLLDAALQGIDIQAMLDGAAEMDVLTRDPELQNNPGGLLALAWYSATGGKGAKDMVILPYKDRLALFSRYLQQLVMESLGKKDDLKGQEVHQGIAVYGNKGSTDQHAYVQQLRDGLNNFFATFLVVESDRAGDSIEVSPGATTGDFLSGMWQGTRQALTEGGRESILITVPDVSPRTVGALIALYERAVGFYGFLVNINAYHQPGVEAGKKAAAAVLKLQDEIVKALGSVAQNAEAVAAKVKSTDIESVFHICRHLAANKRFGVRSEGQGLQSMFAKA